MHRSLRAAAFRRISRARPLFQYRHLSQECLQVVKETLPLVAAAGTDFTSHFYHRLFTAHPELLNTFSITNQRKGRQQKALFSSIAASAISVLETGQLPHSLLESVHHKHCALDVAPEQYDVVGEHILGTIVDLLNPPQSVLDAWGELYGALAKECITKSEELYQATEAREGGWRGQREFVLTAKEKQSSVVTQFTWRPKDGGAVADFVAGQYITLWAHPEGWETRQPRHYTLVNTPNGKEYTIAVKKEHQGLFSSYLHDEVEVGDALNLSAPYGAFHIGNAAKMWTTDKSIPTVLLSAGIGITPAVSMLGALKNDSRPIVWLHAGKNGHEHAFRDYLISIVAAKKAVLTRHVWYSEPLETDIISTKQTGHYHSKGLMDLSEVKDKLPLEHSNAMYFFCGPLPWMQSVAKQLLDLGVSRECLSFESFGPAEEVLPKE